MKRSKKKSRPKGAGGGETASLKTSPARTPVAVGRSRRWLFRLAAAVVVPLLLLATLEAGLRMGGYGYDPHFFKPWHIGEEEYLVQNDAFSFRFFPPQTVRHPGALRMTAVKAPGAIRIFVLGESAAMGDPEPAYGPARFMEVLLRQRYPGVEFEFVNVAFTAINSHVILPIARECAKQDGDLWIIYMGNNEMVGPYGASSAFGLQAPPLPQIRAALFLQQLRLGQLMTALVRNATKPSNEYASWGGMEMFLENQVAPDDPRRETVRHNFQQNLEDMVQAGLDGGARVLLCTVAVNLKDSPPFASMQDASLSDADRAQFKNLLEEARAAVTNSDLTLASERYAEAVKLDPAHAATQYEWARVLLQQTNLTAARDRFQQACDFDTLGFRTDSALNAAIRDTATQVGSANLQLLDAGAALASPGSESIPGEESFYEHVHFNFHGAYQMGLAWAKQVEQMLEQLPEPVSIDWASQQACEDLLGLTDWNRILVLQSMIKRLQVPPFTGQPNNPERIGLLQSRIDQIKAGLNQESVAKAQQAFKQAMTLTPEEHVLYEVQGNFLQARGDLPGAFDAWKRAHELIPHDFLSLFQLGVLSRLSGQQEDAQAYLKRALAVRPALIEAWTELAQSYAAQQKTDAAINSVDQALRYKPNHPGLLSLKAKALLAAGRADAAIPVLQEVCKIQPDSVQSRLQLADAQVASGRIPEAIRQLEVVLQENPGLTSARLNLGVLLVKQGQLEAGRIQFEEVLQADPQNQEAQSYLNQLQQHMQGKSE